MIATVGLFNRPVNSHLHLSRNPPSFPKRPIIYSIPSLNSNPTAPFILKASLPNPQTHFNTQQQPYESESETILLKPLSSFLKTTCIAVVTAALFFSGFTRRASIATATPIAPLYETNETETETETGSDEDNERIVREHLNSNPRDIEALTILMEIKIKNQQLSEAISIVDKLIEIVPAKHWRLLRAHLHNYIGEFDTAKSGFEQVLNEDPLSVEAYHGLAMTASQSQSESGELDNLLIKIENAIELCEKENKKEDLRDFRFLIAQIKFIEKDYAESLKIYQELSKEEPKDFRPYLYQGIMYTLLRQTNEAKQQFDKYKKLVPKDHPYAQYFEDNIISTEAFTEMMQSRNLES